MAFPRASQALSRFTVLDLTRVRSGPTCVRQRADWGANVIKIDALMEDAGGEHPGGPRHGSDFQNLHRNKRAMIPSLKAMSARSSSPRSLRITRGSGSPLADLTATLPGKSPCGRTNMRIKGRMGRADQTTKVKGMFVRPEQVAEIIKRHPALNKARLVVSRRG